MILFLSLLSSLKISYSNSKDSKNEPLRVDADSLQHDDKKLITTFEGNVVLTRNNLIIKGDILKLQQTDDGLAYGHIIGKPALFKQKREVYGDWIEGSAERLDYDERNSMFLLTGNASLKRKMNGQIKDEVSGDKLSYSGQSWQEVRMNPFYLITRRSGVQISLRHQIKQTSQRDLKLLYNGFEA